MQRPQKPGITDGYQYIWNQTKGAWERNGGKIMTIAGTTGLFLTGFHACRKTYKIHDELQSNGERISEAKKARKGDKRGSRAWRVTKEIVKCTAKTSRRYLADAVAGALSAYAVQKGWHKEHKHYQQAAAMVGVVMADFMNYRNNVISEQGEEADRRYMTKQNKRKAFISDEKEEQKIQATDEEGHVVTLDENMLKIWYSRETTPQVWNESLGLRICALNDIQERLNRELIYGGNYTVNDVRRYFYGKKGDIGEGGMFGRIWDPGDPEHPERGAFVNLHFEEDEDFMTGLTDSCWIIIDIDSEPLFELMKRKKDRRIAEEYGLG